MSFHEDMDMIPVDPRQIEVVTGLIRNLMENTFKSHLHLAAKTRFCRFVTKTKW